MLSDNSPPLLISILNYRTPKLAIDCLESLVSEVQALPGTRVIVGDNDSGDGSVELINAAIETNGWGDWASVLPLDHNGGCAFGNNAAIRQGLESDNPPDYFLLLNPDTLVKPGALQILIKFMNEHPQVGLAGSGQELPDGTPLLCAFRFHTILSELDRGWRLGILSKVLHKWIVAPPLPETATQTDWVGGASIMIRREVFEQVGLLDEGYFLYYEEVDLCLRARRAGWTCWYVPESVIIHIVGQSTGVTTPTDTPKRLPQYMFDSRRRYFLKNHGWLYTALADMAWLSGYAVWRVRRVLQGKPDRDPPQLLSDSIQNSVFFKAKLDQMAKS